MWLLQNLQGKLQFLIAHPGFQEGPARALGRTFLWYFTVAFGWAPRRAVPKWKTRFELPSRWKTPAKVFYIFGRRYEKEIEFFEEFLRPGDRMLDIGANFGLYALMAAAKVGPTGRVDAFEPFPESFALLERNIAINQAYQVYGFCLALGEYSSKASLLIHADPGRNSIGSLGDAQKGAISISVEPLDTILAEPARFIDAIKIDVEGWELAVFRGAAKVLRTSRPVIVLEVNPESCSAAGSSYEALVEYLSRLGFEFFVYRGTRTLKRKIPTDFGNWVCIHPEKSGRFADWRFES